MFITSSTQAPFDSEYPPLGRIATEAYVNEMKNYKYPLNGASYSSCGKRPANTNKPIGHMTQVTYTHIYGK